MVQINSSSSTTTTLSDPGTSVVLTIHPNGGLPLVDVVVTLTSIPHTSVADILGKATAAVTNQLSTL